MRYILSLLIVTMTIGLLAGCSTGEIRGVTKPQPKIRSVKLDRNASVLTIDTNRVEFDVTQMRVWRMVDPHGDPVDPNAARRYLQFQYDHGSAQGDSGKAMYILATWSSESIDFTSPYYALVEIRAQVYVYDEVRSSIASIISPELLNLLKAIEAETGKFDPIRAYCGVSEPATRSETETAYAAGLWRLNPDGSSTRLQ